MTNLDKLMDQYVEIEEKIHKILNNKLKKKIKCTCTNLNLEPDEQPEFVRLIGEEATEICARCCKCGRYYDSDPCSGD